ncbi:MAG: LuxR C-terminal-related transcriptional regulator [Pseudomonadota bacterium]
MPNFKSAARASARIRQLATLDISGPQLVPLLMNELHGLFSFNVGIYDHTTADGNYHVFIDEQNADKVLTPMIAHPNFLQLEEEVMRPRLNSLLYEFGPTPMTESMRISRSEYLRHAFHNEALRPAGGDDGGRLLPRLRNGQALGRLIMGRDSRKHHNQLVTRAELQPMARMQHWIAQVLEPRTPTATLEYDHKDSALLVVGSDMRLRHLSPNAERLMTLAFGEQWRQKGALPEELLQILRSIRKINHPDHAGPPPVLDKNSPWGRFNFRAYILDATPENVGDQISTGNHVIAYGITVTHEVPVALRLIEAVHRTRLPPRQTEICYWLARGAQHREIADRCGISINTAIYHSRQIYAHFNANNRQELATQLLADKITHH